MQHAQCVLLFLVLVGNSDQFQILRTCVVTCSYFSHPVLMRFWDIYSRYHDVYSKGQLASTTV